MTTIVCAALVVLAGVLVLVGLVWKDYRETSSLCMCYRFTENQPHMRRCPEARKERELATKLSKFQRTAKRELCYYEIACMEREIYSGMWLNPETGRVYESLKDFHYQGSAFHPACPHEDRFRY